MPKLGPRPPMTSEAEPPTLRHEFSITPDLNYERGDHHLKFSTLKGL